MFRAFNLQQYLTPEQCKNNSSLWHVKILWNNNKDQYILHKQQNANK